MVLPSVRSEPDWAVAERQAKRFALRAYFKRNVGRLFAAGPLDLTDEHAQWAAEEKWWRKPVAVISGGSNEPVVGFFFGFLRGWGNMLYTVEYEIGHFSGSGSSTRGHPGNIEEIIELPSGFEHFLKNYPDDDE